MTTRSAFCGVREKVWHPAHTQEAACDSAVPQPDAPRPADQKASGTEWARDGGAELPGHLMKSISRYFGSGQSASSTSASRASA